MTPSEHSTSQVGRYPKPFVSPELLLSLATAPLLVALVGSNALADAIREVGLLSEELFRGDRLPLLNFPKDTQADPDDRTSP